MAPFLSALPCLSAVLIGLATASNVQSDGSSSAASISQIRDTLKNLLRSIEDSGRDAEALFGKRQLWCDGAIQSFEAANQAASASLSDMQAQLTETQAEVEEAEGTVQQVKVDIEMVQHTIKQTEDMVQERSAQSQDTSSAASLVENKQLSLASLEQELQVTVPVLAQLQASVAETKQRISYRTESVAVAKDFVAALKDGCQGAADRADTQSAARVGESNSIHATLQALNDATNAMDAFKVGSDEKEDSDVPTPPEAPAQDVPAAPVSFIQVTDQSEEVTTDDLSDLFAASQKEKVEVAKEKDSAPEKRQATAEVSHVSPLRPGVQTLLMQLRDAGNTDNMDQAAWCSKQRENSAMALKFAQDSVDQTNAELEANSAAEADLAEELKKLQTLAAAVSESAKTVLEQASKEEALVQSGTKDQVLATKILDQATTILTELGMEKSTKVVSGLDSAKKMLAAQIQAAPGFQKEASAKAKAIGEKALALTQTQESEQHNLELARDDHAQSRERGEANKRLYEADVQEATAFVEKLQETCKADAENFMDQQRSVQVHALEDSQKALDGKLIDQTKSTANSLRGPDQSNPKAAPQNLTPMQRAAMEMGISTE